MSWVLAGIAAALGALPSHVLAQAGPFAAGAAAGQAQMLVILTPIAAIAVMVSGVLGWFGKISWFWLVGVVIGTVLVFGSQQIVAWIRGIFGV